VAINQTRRPLRGSFLYEFSSGIGDLSTRCAKRNRERNWFPLPALIGTDESQPVIPGGMLSSSARFRFTGQNQHVMF
jgi:hypothetical protein